MIDTQNLDDIEKINIMFKDILGFPSTSDNLEYYQEVQTNFNTYTLGENVLLENIIQKPNFDISGIARTANELGLLEQDFYDYSYNPLSKSISSIVDDSTGTIRRFRYLILQETPGTDNIDPGASWYKLDTSRNNILEDSIQYNYKSYYDLDNDNALTYPYLYEVFTERSLQEGSSNIRNLLFGVIGGNWIYNYKNGILFFSDVNNPLQRTSFGGIYDISATNRPVISVYKYIGKKSINTLTINVTEQINDLYKQASIFKENFIKMFTYVQNLSHKITNVKDLFNNNSNINTNYSNKSIFSATEAYTTINDELIDLSNSFFNTITPINDNTNILVTVNAVLYCSYSNNNRIKIQVWRDLSMIVDTSNIGSINATNGLVVPYSITHLDENINRNLKKYYLKYQLENSSSIRQGIINVRNSQSQQEGSSDILLREIKKTPNYTDFTNFSNKLLFDTNRYITISNNEFIDLSNSFFNTIQPCNNHFILVNINVSLSCGSDYKDNLSVQLWNDTTMLLENTNIGTPVAVGEFIFPYNITYLDENYDNNTKKYYLKYKLENDTQNITRSEGGICNIRTPSIYGSSNIILQEYRNISYNPYNNKSATFTNVVSKTTSTDLVDLSNIIFQTVNSCNNSNIIVYINVSLFCCKEYRETLTIELWRDNTLIMRDSKLGTQIGRSGFLTMPYNVTYLDEKVSNGTKKYYLKYKRDYNRSILETGLTNFEQGIIDIKTSPNFGSPNILLNEITNTLTISNKQFFDVSYITTNTDQLMDLSNLFFNTISLTNQASVMVNINVSILSGYAYRENITIELWRDSIMLTQDINLGTLIGSGGFIFPYNLTYLDTSVNSGITKYYLKYKVRRDTSNTINNYGEAGLINIRTLQNPYGSSSFFLRQT